MDRFRKLDMDMAAEEIRYPKGLNHPNFAKSLPPLNHTDRGSFQTDTPSI